MLSTEKDAFDTTLRRQRLYAIAASILAVLCLAFALALGVRAFETGIKPVFGGAPDSTLSTQPPDLVPVSGTGPEALSQAFSNVAKVVGPAVVHINVVKVSSNPSAGFGFGLPFESPQREEGSGSGVLVNANGYIVTNYHVVGKAKSIEVKLADGRRLKGTVVGTDEPTDLAVIKVEGSDLPSAMLGDSDTMKQGDWVVALGSPFGLEQTITAGIVSATGRRLQASPYDAFIQTDASINPGNSGGPLVNLRGEIIGINTLIFTRSGGSQGIGFAIPSSMVKRVYEQLVSGNGKVIRGYLGISVGDLTPALAESLGLDREAVGALVADVADDNTPAAKAGLQSGDVIVEVEGKPVRSGAELTNAVADLTPGTTVTIRFLRDGSTQQAEATLAERPDPNQVRGDIDSGGPSPDTSSGGGRLGIEGRDLTPEIATQLRSRSNTGVVISAVAPNGPAARAGLRRGDVITRVGRTPVKSIDELRSALEGSSSSGELVLQVERAGRFAFVTVEVGE